MQQFELFENPNSCISVTSVSFDKWLLFLELMRLTGALRYPPILVLLLAPPYFHRGHYNAWQVFGTSFSSLSVQCHC
jgi:hypothetical protein